MFMKIIKSASLDTLVAISIDADLQDDPSVIYKMIEQYYEGSQIVFGVRNDRSTDSWAKKFFAQSYYKVLRKMGVDIIEDHADFRLMSKKALNTLRDFKEVNLFFSFLLLFFSFMIICI